MPKERAITARILEFLNRLPNAYFFKTHGSQYHSGEPDVVGCLKGRTIVVEVKQEGERSRPVQRAVQSKWLSAGAIVVVDATCWEDVWGVIEQEMLSRSKGYYDG